MAAVRAWIYYLKSRIHCQELAICMQISLNSILMYLKLLQS